MKRFRLARLGLGLLLPLLVYVAACTRDPKEVAKKYVDTGNKYFKNGKYKEASIMYRRALQKDMKNAEAHYRLGLVDLKEGMLGEAHKSLLRATDLDKNNVEALARLGEIDLAIYMYDPIFYKSSIEDVKDVAKRLLDKNPKSYDGLRLSGFVALGNKDLPTAIEKFKEADQIKPNQPDLVYALSNALYHNKQPEEAERVAKQVIATHKDYGPIYDLLYMQYASSNRSADAERILQEKVANNPKNGANLVQLAYHYFQARRPDDMFATLARLTSNPTAFPTGHLMAGDLYLRTGYLDKALHEYQEGEKSDAKNKIVYSKRQAEALTREGKSTEASQVVSQLLKTNPKDTEAVSMHAVMLLQTRDPKQVQKAIDELKPLLASTPLNEKGALQMLHFNLARAYMAKADRASLDQAAVHLDEVLKIDQNYIPGKMARAELMLLRGEPGKAVQAADEVISKMPNNLAAHLIRTQGLINIGDLEHARQELAVITQAVPQSNDARYQVAQIDFTQKRYKEAEAGFEALNKANDPRGFSGLMRSKMQQGDFDGAIQLVQGRIRQEPDQLQYRRLLGDIEAAAKRYDAAIAEYQTIAQKEPSVGNYVRLGDIQRDSGNVEAAIASYRKGRELQPNEPYPVLELAVLYDFTNRPDEARKNYEEVLKLQPDNAVALNNLAYSMADQGVDLDKALTYAERARQKLPDNLSVNDTIGLIYLRKNLVEEGARVLSDLVTRDPNNALFHLHYATALYQKGDKAAAKKELDAAVRNGPSDKEKLRIQELRQKLS